MPELIPLFLAGATGVGKSAIALAVAQRLHGEIISVDSMQVYRGMDIGTAKPSRADRALVPHHLIDIVELHDTFDAAAFVESARRACQSIATRGQTPIFCGGTGLYFKAYLYGLGSSPSGDPDLRAQLEALPSTELLEELHREDPVIFERIDRSNRRRLIRAVEVIRLTGKPFSAQRASWSNVEASAAAAPVMFGIARSREDLVRRIELRVDQMIAVGLIREVQSLRERGLDRQTTASQALGYKQVLEHLAGLRALEDTIALIKQATRQYAKRQMTWFRRQLTLDWISLGRGAGPEEAAASIVRAYQARVAEGKTPSRPLHPSSDTVYCP